MNDEPLAFFITWTVYGTFLQGDERGWHKWKQGSRAPEPRLAEWRAERLKYPVLSLDREHRECIKREIRRLSEFRGWQLWAAGVRSNHVHVVVQALGFAGSKVRDQLKANCTRVLREKWSQFVDRPVWSEGGDWKCVNDERGLERVILYATEAQDRKGLDDV